MSEKKKATTNHGPDAWLPGEIVGSECWRHRLSPAAKEIYLQLKRYQDGKKKVTRMSVIALMNLSGISARSTFEAAIRELAQHGILEDARKPRAALAAMLGIEKNTWFWYVR